MTPRNSTSAAKLSIASEQRVLRDRLIQGSIERTDAWKSHLISKPVFDTHEACVAKEYWKRSLV